MTWRSSAPTFRERRVDRVHRRRGERRVDRVHRRRGERRVDRVHRRRGERRADWKISTFETASHSKRIYEMLECPPMHVMLRFAPRVKNIM